MTLLSPSAAMHHALAEYLNTAIVAVTGLGDSICLTHWPEPTEPLELSETRVVLALERAGAPDDGDRIGGPVRARIDVAGSGSATARYDYGQIEQSFTLGMWAVSEAMRDELDEIAHRLLNQPFASTVLPIVTTTLAFDAGIGTREVIPDSMADIWPDTRLKVGTEVVLVQSTTATTFTASFLSAHSAGEAITEVLPITGQRAATGLRLRAPSHLNAIARFDFDQPRYMDTSASERQEWRSIRQGIGAMPQLRSVSVPLQESLTVRLDSTNQPIF